ncbi:MAG: prephenate dehydratase [Thermodesulfobacteriota bacterium]
MGSTTNFDKLRQKIDSLDQEILKLLNERGGIALEIRKLKMENSVGVYDPVREKLIENKLRDLNTGPFSDDSVLNIFREIISASRSLQETTRVAYLGPEGSFSHQAAYNEFGGSSELIPLGSFEEIFEEVENGRATFGVVPVENSIEGSVSIVLDLLSKTHLGITAELFERINHFLLSKTGNIQDISIVASHPQAIAQCKKWLNKNLGDKEVLETASTAEAARLASKKKNVSAIASEHAASIYKLNTVQNNIEESSLNTTRFFVIGNKTNKPTGDDRTSIVFTLKDKPGALQNSFFQPFADAKVNLSKIESRPSKERPWEYLFFVDFKGHFQDKTIKSLLKKLDKSCIYLKVLGSYPTGN